MKITPYCALLGLTFLGACAVGPQSITTFDASSVANLCKVQRDDFKKTTSIVSVAVDYNVEWSVMNGYWRNCFYELQSVKKDNGEVSYFLVWDSQSADWIFWQSATDQNGKDFEFSGNERNVISGAQVHEWQSAVLAREYLDSIKTSGIMWRIYGKSINTEIKISSNLVQGFLQRSDAELGRN